MIDTAKLDALEHQLRNRHFDGLAPELIEVIGLARLVLAAQAAPGEVEAVARALHEAHKPWCDYTYAFEDPMAGREIYEVLARAALLAAALHRPVEARVTEGLEALAQPEPCSDEEAAQAVRNSASQQPLPTVAELQAILDEPDSLPIPQVTLEEVYSLIMKHEKATFGHIAWPRLLADRILSLFDGKAKP